MSEAFCLCVITTLAPSSRLSDGDIDVTPDVTVSSHFVEMVCCNQCTIFFLAFSSKINIEKDTLELAKNTKAKLRL